MKVGSPLVPRCEAGQEETDGVEQSIPVCILFPFLECMGFEIKGSSTSLLE